MNEEIYEVNRDEYAGFMNEIKPECRDAEIIYQDNYTLLKVISKKTKKHLCSRYIFEDGNEKYYIYEMPDNDERQRGKPVRKITLETKEEVQAFFDILSNISKENKIND